jgi:predicted nucleic acid-binding protein
MIGAHDLIIAATALSHGCAVLTTNAAEFARVPGLEVLAPMVS